MNIKIGRALLSALLVSILLSGCSAFPTGGPGQAGRSPAFEELFYETTNSRTLLPVRLIADAQLHGHSETNLPDGRVVTISVKPEGNDFSIHLSARPDGDIIKWGLAMAAAPDEYFTGLMERVVDGPQQASWATNLTATMDLRGQKVEMILKPTTSIYAPFYLSSRGYAVFVKGNWPGRFDFCASVSNQVQIEFEGPSFAAKIYTAADPAALVCAHALEAGPPFLPPKWMYGPWRWRDENTQRTNYYDGTPVTGPFNSEFMEDVLLMKAYGIPLGVYWVDRPWGPGENGYDDFEIDTNRLPNFAESVKWLNGQEAQMFLWIGPFFQGQMETNALAKGWTLASAGQKPSKNNYPLVDFTHPEAKKYWQDGVAKLLKLGVAGFKMDRAEENMPESGLYQIFDGRSIREYRNAYPVLYLQAAYDVAKEYRGDNFVCMPRAAYTGSAACGVFWGGDIAGTPEGLRAEIIAVQRAAVMGYPNWGSDTCGYNQQSMDTEVCGRWLAFSCFTPIMEVGPTRNRAFWNFHNPPAYDAELIAIWRLYARLHARLADYSLEQAKTAHETGLPIVRSLFLVDPNTPAAWSNWWTYLYGPDILVSPIWQKDRRTQEVYLPSGSQWRDAWNPGKIHEGGQTITVNAGLHQLPIFVRVGSRVELGDLNKEWSDAVAAANTRPDLKKLDSEVKAWFDGRK
jgi:alpha-glucosidase (family GH31 glycosyl hydrolase)